MTLDLRHHDKKSRDAVAAFWQHRAQAKAKQVDRGKSDQGERAGVTAGKNMDGFLSLVIDTVKANGLKKAEIHQKRAVVTLPGHFRPTKLWDLLVMDQGELIVAIELKSQVGPSFGNNFNNRAEEAIGTAMDFWTAYREGALGAQVRPFVGWLMLVEDAPASRKPVKDASPHFPVNRAFENASYLQRYDVLCQRLMQEQLYSAAALLASPNSLTGKGEFSSLSDMTSLRSFMASLAGHVAGAAARKNK